MSTTFEPFDTELPSPATAWSPGEAIEVPGPPGPQGPTGPAPNLTIGTVTSGISPAATITGVNPNYQLNLQLPQGPTGSTGLPGTASSLAIGTVTSGTPAAATITGTPPSQVLNLTIPPGAAGPLGPAGPAGSVIWQGSGPPANSLGINGDYYVDAADRDWWGPKASGSWPASPSFSLVANASLPRRSLLTRSTNQAVGAWPVKIAFQASANLNVTGTWSAGQPSRIVIPAGVSYAQVTVQAEVDGGATAGTLSLEVYKNGVILAPRVFNNSGRNTTTGSAVNILVASSYQIPVVAGDFLEIEANQTSLSANNIIAASLWAQATFS